MAKSYLEDKQMIKRTYKMLVGLALLLVGGLTMTANAQVPSDSILKANIPFSFMVQDKTFPAGEYTIKQSGADDDSEFVLEISSDSGKGKTMVFNTTSASEDQTPAHSNLVFDKFGDKYFLSKIFVAGDNDGNQVEESKMEKNLEKGNVTKEKYVLKTGHWKEVEKVEVKTKGI
jgi:hypothetical protein